MTVIGIVIRMRKGLSVTFKTAMTTATIKAVRNESTTEPEEVSLLKIGQLAKSVDETVRTIRFWTGEGLLNHADTTASGYALYDPDCVLRIRKIQKLKKQRYTLREIREMLD